MKQGWEIKKLGEVCDFQGGSQPPKSNFIFEPRKGYVRFLQIRDFGSDKNITYIPEAKKNRHCNEDDILLGRYGASVGKVLVNKAGAYNVAVMKTIPDEKVLYKRYLFFYLNTDDFQSRLLKTASRSAQDGFSKDDIFDFPILIPPLPEQQRIVSIFDEAFAALAKAKGNAEQNLKNAKELFESYLKGVFENKLHGSKFETLDSLCELIVDCEHKTAPTQETGYPSIRTPNIGKGVLILEGVNRVSEKTYNEWTRRAIPQADDLILAREAPAGNIAVIPENVKVCLGQRTVLIRPKKNKLISKFLAHLILSKDVQEQLLSHSTGATVEHINMKDIRAFKIYNLSPLTEQQTIVQNLEALLTETQKLEAIYQQKINDIEELKKSVLQKAFAGELNTQKVMEYVSG
ncbi:MAG TPA: restriction endonuclease subunit S [Chitinophagaceae bacterium]